MADMRRTSWWQKGFSVAVSVAMVMGSTPMAALAEALDDPEAPDELAVVLEEEGAEVPITEDELDALVAGEEGEEVALEEGDAAEEAAPQDDEDALEASESEDPVPAEEVEGAGEEAEPVAEPEMDDIELTAQDVSLVGSLPTDGEWRTSTIGGTDVAAYNAATDSEGRVAALTAQAWQITVRQSVTLSADVWSKGSSFRWWITNDEISPISSENTVAKSASDTQSVYVTAGTYYLFIASDTTVGGTYAVRAYTARRNFGNATVGSVSSKTYTGAAQVPAVTVRYNGATLVKGVDYTVTGKNNTKAGTATLTIAGKGLYAGSKSARFKIVKRSIKKCKVTVGTKAWTGKPIKAKPTVKIGGVTLKKGVDYKIVRYTKNKKVGTATVTLKGKGGLKGTRTVKFKIRYNISKSGTVMGYYRPGTTTFNRFVFKKTGAKMKAKRDYKLSVVENSASKKVYKMVGKGNYTGTTYFTFYK